MKKKPRNKWGVPVTVVYKSQTLELYKFGVLRKILGRSPNTCLRLERLGALPAPLFRSTDEKGRPGVRYYTNHQLQELQKLKYDHGAPGEYLNRKAGSYVFWNELRTRWDYLYRCYNEGRIPETPVILEFSNKLELRNSLSSYLHRLGVRSNAALDDLESALLFYRKA